MTPHPSQSPGAPAPNEKPQYHVKLWDTDEIVRSTPHLNRACGYARGMGHTGEDNPGLTGYPPIARVVNDVGECVYNPRFNKSVGSHVGMIVQGMDDCLRS